MIGCVCVGVCVCVCVQVGMYVCMIIYGCRVVRPDGRVEDLGDFTDLCLPPASNMEEYEKKQHQELQDEVRQHVLVIQTHDTEYWIKCVI